MKWFFLNYKFGEKNLLTAPFWMGPYGGKTPFSVPVSDTSYIEICHVCD